RHVANVDGACRAPIGALISTPRGRLARLPRSPADVRAPDQEAPVPKYAFLSDEWFAEVQKLVDEHGADAPSPHPVVVNIVVTGSPFGEERQMHMGAKDGKGEMGPGHVDDPDLTLTTDHCTAKNASRP